MTSLVSPASSLRARAVSESLSPAAVECSSVASAAAFGGMHAAFQELLARDNCSGMSDGDEDGDEDEERERGEEDGVPTADEADDDGEEYVPHASVSSRPRDIPRAAIGPTSSRRSSLRGSLASSHAAYHATSAYASTSASGGSGHSASSSAVPSWSITSRQSLGATAAGAYGSGDAASSRRISFSQQCLAAAAQSDSALSTSMLASSSASASAASATARFIAASSLPAPSHAHLQLALPTAVPLAIDGRASGRTSRRTSGRNSPSPAHGLESSLARSVTDAPANFMPFASRRSPPPVPVHVHAASLSGSSWSSSLPPPSPVMPSLMFLSPSPSPAPSPPSSTSPHPRPPLPPPSAARLEEVASYDAVARWPPHVSAAVHRRNSLVAAQLASAGGAKKEPLRCQTSEEAARAHDRDALEEDDDGGFPFSLHVSQPRGSADNGNGYELEFEL